MSAITPDPILQIASGYMAAKHLFTANAIGLFPALAAGPATLDELAQRTGIARRRVRIVADALAAVGLIERHNGSYQNSPAAATFLSGAGTANLRPLLAFWDQISYPAWMAMEDVVRTGEPAVAELTAEQNRIFAEGVEAITAAAAHGLAAGYAWSSQRRLLDVGGGTGSFLLAVLQQAPHLQATLFETPSVAAVARKRTAGQPVQIVEGNFFQDELPGDHDALLLANVIHLFGPERNHSLLRSARRAVQSTARLLLVDFWTDPTHTQPPIAALLAGEFLAVTGEGDVYSVDEMRATLSATGWKFVEHRPLAGPASLIVAEAM